MSGFFIFPNEQLKETCNKNIEECVVVLDCSGLKKKSILVISALLLHVGLVANVGAAESGQVAPQGVFATVDKVEISKEDFDIAMQSAMRTKFYHGTIPEGELANLQREIGNKLIDDLLLFREAGLRGIVADQEQVATRLKEIEGRNSAYPEWKDNRDKYIHKIRQKLEQESVLKKLEEQVKSVGELSRDQIEQFYKQYPEKFTEPEQVRISAILLRVDPSSPSEQWLEAQNFAKGLVKRISEGEDFAAIAKELSDDRNSAEFGGDMGYLHQGMLPEDAQVIVDKMEVGALSEPIRLLQGVTIIKLTDRSKSTLRPFESVMERAADLLRKDLQEQAWQGLVKRLRSASLIEINDGFYAPLVVKVEEEKTTQKP